MAITFHPDGTVTGNTLRPIVGSGGPGNVINVTHGQHATTGMSTQSTTFVRYTNSDITVTKLRGPGNVSGGSYLLVLAGAWIEFESNNKHLAYSIMRDGTEVTGKSRGLGNLYSSSAGGYQSSADMKYMDIANLNAGNYVYSLCICNTNGGSNVQVGNASRLSTWQILEIAT